MPNTHLTPRFQSIRKTIYGAAAALLAILFPLVLDYASLPILSSTYGKKYQVFEYFGFSAGALLLAALIWKLRKINWQNIEEILQNLLPFGVAFLYLSIITEYSIASWDYLCYQEAAANLLAGQPIYAGYYLYPPLLAQALAFVYKLIDFSAIAIFQTRLIPDDLWRMVFYFYQCAQYCLVLATYQLCWQLTRRLRIQKWHGLLLVTALFVVNNPLIRTIRHNQINLWILLFLLCAILLLERRQFLSGFAIALGGHLKLYPLILLVPWFFAKKYRAWVGAAAGVILILVIQVFAGRGISLWAEYIVFFPQFPQVTDFRDNSFHSFAYSLIRLSGIFGPPDGYGFRLAVTTFTVYLSIVSIVWLARRYIEVERRFAGDAWREMRALAHTMDALAAMLLISPMVWEHHFVFIIPLVIWAYAVSGKRYPIQLVIAAGLMLAIPTFDIFPFSSHRLAGLIWLLALTSSKILDLPEEDKR